MPKLKAVVREFATTGHCNDSPRAFLPFAAVANDSFGQERSFGRLPEHSSE